MHDHYLSVVLAALSILVIGCWNPPILQSAQNGKPLGYPNYMWLALIALIVGLLSCYLMEESK
jgi:hypothetical protein